MFLNRKDGCALAKFGIYVLTLNKNQKNQSKNHEWISKKMARFNARIRLAKKHRNPR